LFLDSHYSMEPLRQHRYIIIIRVVRRECVLSLCGSAHACESQHGNDNLNCLQHSAMQEPLPAGLATPRSGTHVIEVCFGTVEVLGGLLLVSFEIPDSAEFLEVGI
jgi:hypothetical protein